MKKYLFIMVLFRYRGGHLLHRIIRREGDRLWIQGEARLWPSNSA